MGIKVETDHALRQLLDQVSTAQGNVKSVLVGVTSKEGAQYPTNAQGQKSKVNLATVASFLHAGWVQRVTPKQSGYLGAAFGVHVKPGNALVLPPRPFILAPFLADQNKIQKIIANRLQIRQGFPLQEALVAAGAVLAGDMQQGIKQGGFAGTKYEPRSPMTKEINAAKSSRKGKKAEASSGYGRNEPLLVQGTLLNAINYELDQ